MSTYGSNVGHMITMDTTQTWGWGSYTEKLTSVANGIANYELSYTNGNLHGSTTYGIQVHPNNVLKVNGTGDTGDPTSYSITRSGTTIAFTNDNGVIQLGDFVNLGLMGFTVTANELWPVAGSTSTNSGSVTQNMDGSLSFQVDAGSDSSETYIIQLDSVQKATITPTGVGPWYRNYTFAEHTTIGYGIWSLVDQNGVLGSIPTTAPNTNTPSSTATSKRKVSCNFW